MRFHDFKHFISEETIDANTLASRNSHYYRNLVNLIRNNTAVQVTLPKTRTSAKIAKTVTFDPEAADILEKIWNPKGSKDEKATPEQVDAIKNTFLPATDGKEYKVTQVEKTKDIKQTVGAEGEETNSKWWNKGNVAEGIMACAVVTKFETEGAVIDGEAVFHTAQRLTSTLLETTAYGKTVQLKITLSGNDFKALLMASQQPQEFLKYDKSREIYKLFVDCATYVNESSNVKTALAKIQAAQAGDIIAVTADGATAEAQHSTKADLWISVNGKKERLLSIKTATVKHIGAVSGYEFNHISNFFESVVGFGLPEEMRKTFKAPPVGLPKGHKKSDPLPTGYKKMSQAERSAAIATARAYNYEHGTKKAYQYVFKQINAKLKGDDSAGEYDFVTTVTNGVVHHATLGEDVRLVIISPSAKEAYKELEFGPALYQALENYDLIPVLNLEGANYKLLVYGFPKTEKAKRVNNDKSLFVQLRSYVQDSAARNVVEIGGLLKNLTEVSKTENTSSTELGEPVIQPPTNTTTPKPVAPAPVVKATAPVAPAPAVNAQPVVPTTNQIQDPLANDKEVAEELGDKDLERIRHLSGIVSHMSKNF